MKHLTYGGSTAARTLACPGWVQASKHIPRRPPGAAAINGSMHHMVMEMCQEQNKAPADFIGAVYKEGQTERVFTEDDLDLSERAHKALNDICDELDIDAYMVEPFVQLVPGKAGGSIDYLALSKDETILLVLDFKFGRYPVLAENSAQHFLYAVSARKDPDTADMFKKVKKIIFAVVQPTANIACDTWAATKRDLTAFEKKFLKAMDSDEVHPGKHCQFCPAAPPCPTKRADVVAAQSYGARGRADLQASADMVEQVEDWLNSVKQELYFQIGDGLAIKGWKIVDRKATRKWRDEAEAEAALRAAGVKVGQMIKKSLITAPQADKLLKKLKLEFPLDDYVEKKSSGTTLAPEHDSREPVVVSENPDALKKLIEDNQ